MKKRVRLFLIAAAAVFALLFIGRFAYLLAARESGQGALGGFGPQLNFVQESSSISRKNYASAKVFIPGPASGAQMLEQKYERVANLSSASDAFDEDSAAAYNLAASAGALVQSENSYGLRGSRSLALSFGVTPEQFEPFVDGLKLLGSLESVTVVKTDKTADYKELEARRLSLEKTRDGLRALKAPGAALADLIALETKILEIEGQIQELGVSLGDYAEGNSFCTVNFSLAETRRASLGPRVAAALFDALEWSLLAFLGLALAALLGLGAALLASLAVDKALSYIKKP
jgi:hypothetical protein